MGKITGTRVSKFIWLPRAKPICDLRPGYGSREIQLKPGRISLNSISKSSSGSSEYVPRDPMQGSVHSEQKRTRNV